MLFGWRHKNAYCEKHRPDVEGITTVFETPPSRFINTCEKHRPDVEGITTKGTLHGNLQLFGLREKHRPDVEGITTLIVTRLRILLSQ